jgi:ABC-type multidrug transport system permease subunit
MNAELWSEQRQPQSVQMALALLTQLIVSFNPEVVAMALEALVVSSGAAIQIRLEPSDHFHLHHLRMTAFCSGSQGMFKTNKKNQTAIYLIACFILLFLLVLLLLFCFFQKYNRIWFGFDLAGL